MRDAENILEIAALSPDYMGFIFYDKSPRFVGEHFVIPAELNPVIRRVGVFVKADVSAIEDAIQRHRLDVIQLHGGESVEEVKSVKALGVEVWKVFSVDEHFDFAATEAYEHVADRFLFDSRGKYYGGNAVAFDWNKLGEYHQRRSFLLSGGLTVDNVSGLSSLRAMNLHGIDINSGAEIKPGLKDPQKVKSFIDTIYRQEK
ncbi:MAG TPA: phosphoribosylanthranilate isomerase [Ohtaekwangia sp.]|nr:phosphoribosylanthranilate isomerase [Ohtaekwangia sp.]